MSRSRTPAYIIKTKEAKHYTTPMAWNYKRLGKPSDAKLLTEIELLEASTMLGGVNEHLGQMFVSSAEVIHQASGDVVASYTAPMFKVN